MFAGRWEGLVLFYPDLAFVAWVAARTEPCKAIIPFVIPFFIPFLTLLVSWCSREFRSSTEWIWGQVMLLSRYFSFRFKTFCSPWFTTPPGLTQKWLYLFNVCLFVGLFRWIKPVILIFFFSYLRPLLIEKLNIQQVEWILASSLEQDTPWGFWDWVFLCGNAINSLPGGVQQRIML